jgi:pimeloyl-ACP methyl ester carboxylesterase
VFNFSTIVIQSTSVVSVDLPGLGAREDEKLSKTAAIDAIADVIKKFGKNGKAVLVGHSMGGYLAMQFGSEHPEMTAGLVLSGCASESSGVGSAAIYGAMGAVYKVFVPALSNLAVQFLIVSTTALRRANFGHSCQRHSPEYPKKRWRPLICGPRSITKSMPILCFQHSCPSLICLIRWNDASTLLQEPYANYYLMCLTSYDGQVLFLTGEKDFRTSEDRFLLYESSFARVSVPQSLTLGISFAALARREKSSLSVAALTWRTSKMDAPPSGKSKLSNL